MNRVTAYAFASLLLASPAIAEEKDPMQEFEDAAKDAASQIVEVLRSLLRAVPQYEAPEILDNGDIIIRRKQRPDTDEDRPPPRVKKTSSERVL